MKGFFKKKQLKKAFSFPELAIVILILGIIASTFVAADAIIKRIRLSNARALTEASPVRTIDGASLWLESSLDSSFSSEEADNGKKLAIWYDNLPSQDKNNATQET